MAALRKGELEELLTMIGGYAEGNMKVTELLRTIRNQMSKVRSASSTTPIAAGVPMAMDRQAV